MHRFSLYIVVSLTFLLLFLEGIGNVFVHTYFAFFSTPLLIAAILLILHNKTAHSIPPLSIFGWVLLLSSVVLSTFGFSILKHESLFMSFLFFHFCAFFVLGNIYKHELIRIVPRLIIIWAVGTLAYSGYIFFSKSHLDNAYQFVYPTFGSHNHGGELSALALLILLYIPSPLLLRVIISITLTLSVFFSFSRSAYIWVVVSYLIGALLYRAKVRVVHGGVGVVVVGIIMIGLLSTIRPLPTPHLAPVQQFLMDTFHMVPRAIVSGRDAYFSQSFRTIQDNPFWGSGVGSFTFATQKHTSEFSLRTDHAHNFLLEVGVEQGMLGLIGVLCILLATLWSIVRYKPPVEITVPFLFLLFTFQTDYIYAINGILLLFFLLSGMLSASTIHRSNQTLTHIVTTFAVIQIVWIDMVIASTVALGFNKPELAIKLYPLSVPAYHKILNTLSYENAHRYVDGYVYTSPNTSTYLDVAAFYTKHKNTIEAIPYYERAVLSNPSLDLSHIITYATILNSLEAPHQMQTLKKSFSSTYNSYKLYELPSEIHPKVREVCALIEPACDSIHWYSEIKQNDE